ncbi:MAG: quinol:electron acceptor oxidoreductase subunit ActD, partial [Myxococcota bacterium]
FELTILFGGLLTALGLFIVGRLPRFTRDAAYSARFSAEDFGVAVRCPERDVAEVDGLMRAHGAVEVNLVAG